jgi:hypothetical protein
MEDRLVDTGIYEWLRSHETINSPAGLSYKIARFKEAADEIMRLQDLVTLLGAMVAKDRDDHPNRILAAAARSLSEHYHAIGMIPCPYCHPDSLCHHPSTPEQKAPQ